MQVDITDVVRLMGAGFGVGIALSFLPWVVGIMVSFAINLYKKA